MQTKQSKCYFTSFKRGGQTSIIPQDIGIPLTATVCEHYFQEIISSGDDVVIESIKVYKIVEMHMNERPKMTSIDFFLVPPLDPPFQLV